MVARTRCCKCMFTCIVFLLYMPNNSRFGIKKFKLCDSVTGYVQLYAGKDLAIRSDMGHAHNRAAIWRGPVTCCVSCGCYSTPSNVLCIMWLLQYAQ